MHLCILVMLSHIVLVLYYPTSLLTNQNVQWHLLPDPFDLLSTNTNAHIYRQGGPGHNLRDEMITNTYWDESLKSTQTTSHLNIYSNNNNNLSFAVYKRGTGSSTVSRFKVSYT